MGTVKKFPEAALVIGILMTGSDREALLSALLEAFGPILTMTEPKPFTFTDYYDEEMGGKPHRFFVMHQNLIAPDTLAQTKLKTNDLEKRFSQAGNRRINLDPGILSLHNFILATTKNRVHRIPLRDGVYGEVTLQYKNKEFCPFSWTYADYRTPDICRLFEDFRQKLKQNTESSRYYT